MHAPSADTRALLIDALGTLVSLLPPAPLLAGELARRFAIEVSVADAQRALATEIAYYRAHMGEGRDADSLADLRGRCAEVLRAALPRSDRLAGLRPEALTGALLGCLAFTPFDDARPALVAARAAGARVVVVSNWDVSLADVLERIGLAPLVDGVVTSAAIGAAKPDSAIFAHALALAGVQPARALHVGDSLEEDVRGAAALGIPAVLLRRSPAADTPAAVTPSAVRVIAGLGELAWA
jgi:putative hydrolase of the HAD superfamily